MRFIIYLLIYLPRLFNVIGNKRARNKKGANNDVISAVVRKDDHMQISRSHGAIVDARGRGGSGGGGRSGTLYISSVSKRKRR
jgi:hypothetical protein